MCTDLVPLLLQVIFVHDEFVAMTHDKMLTRNIPEFYDHSGDPDSSRHSISSDNSYGEGLLDIVDYFAGTDGARLVDVNTARVQVTRYLEALLEGQCEVVRVVGDLAADIATMSFLVED
jgi:hypothetical protein